MKRLLTLLAIGGARLELSLEGQEHPRGANIHGKVWLTGGAVPQRVDSLTVALVEYTQTGKRNTLDGQQLRSAATVHPHSVEEYAFSIGVPDEALLSRSFINGTKVVAEADIPGPVMPCVAAAVNIVPHREIVAIRRAMAALGFREQARSRLKLLLASFEEGYRNAIVVRYDPPEALRTQVHDVRLHLRVEMGEAICAMFVHGRKFTLNEALMELTFSEVDPLALRIPCRDLRDLEGRPRSEGAIDRLEEHLNRLLARPDAVQYALLRASCAPASAPDELMRPAMPVQDSSEDELLRAIDDGPPSGKRGINT